MLDRLLGHDFLCSDGRIVRVNTRAARVARGALSDVQAFVRALLPAGPLWVVDDENTHRAAGASVRQTLGAFGHTIPGDAIAGPVAVSELVAKARGAASLVAVGSGTVNDIVKSAATELGVPYVAVGTALSMNGYTSAISALLVDGVKRTLPATPPVGVLIDLDLCAAAPRALTLAGLGDMLSKPFSEADWRLSHHVLGDPWVKEPGELLATAFPRMVKDATDIGAANPDALASLAECLLLSGLSMAIAGASSPASGAEHLISHYWDMMCYARDEHPHGLHGTQVGIACCLVEPLHHRVASLGALPASAFNVDAAVAAHPATRVAAEAQVLARHGRLPEAVVAAIAVEALKKWVPRDVLRERLLRVRDGRDAILAHVREALLPYGAVRHALEASGGPTSPEALHAELAGDLDDWTVARDIRARYTVFDFASEWGLGPGGPNEGLACSERAGARA
ncbi:MAG: iron-containing alcohol dehydrogenase [Myxococcales bacterium]|nr:iron-containing alcohol dehydrogenase [Myxococcales bacterium]